jgi:hypothetical protein
MAYAGGQRSSRRSNPQGNPFQSFVNWLNTPIGQPVRAGGTSPVPIRSDQLPPGAFMNEAGVVRGMSSEQVPKGGYMTETGRVYVPAGFGGFPQYGPPTPARVSGAPAAPVLPSAAPVRPAAAPGFGTATIVRGTRDGVTPDRTQSDEYRAQLAQYGALSKAGKQEEAEKLGMEIWQQKYGKTPMAQPGGAVGAFNPLMQKTFGYQAGASPTEPYYAGSPSADFAVAANAVPAPWNQQGMKVSQEFAGVVPFQAAKTTGEGMPAFQTTGEKAAEFLRNTKLTNLF